MKHSLKYKGRHNPHMKEYIWDYQGKEIVVCVRKLSQSPLVYRLEMYINSKLYCRRRVGLHFAYHFNPNIALSYVKQYFNEWPFAIKQKE